MFNPYDIPLFINKNDFILDLMVQHSVVKFKKETWENEMLENQIDNNIFSITEVVKDLEETISH